MAMTAEKFLDFVERSGLVEKDQLTQSLDSLRQSDPIGWDDGERLAECLIEANFLTRWQCGNLLKGRYKRFFLGQFKLQKLLGVGDMHSVYLAEHTILTCQRAVKVMPTSRSNDPSNVARFRQVAVTASQLNHPNIVQTFDVGEDGGVYYIVREYVEGGDLLSIVKKLGPIDFRTTADYIRQAAEGLSHAHHKGQTHGDVRPTKLLVNNLGVIKFLNFGSSWSVDQKSPSRAIANEENVVGIADYVAPEQAIEGTTVDLRADIYSLGCTLYFLLTGHPPFPASTVPQLIYMHRHKAPASIYDDRPDAPAALVDLCMRMMAKTPDERRQTADEVASALTAWLAENPLSQRNRIVDP